MRFHPKIIAAATLLMLVRWPPRSSHKLEGIHCGRFKFFKDGRESPKVRKVFPKRPLEHAKFFLFRHRQF